MTTAEKKKLFKALLLLPFNVLVVIPTLILIFSKSEFRLPDAGLMVLGSLFFVFGLGMAFFTVRLFIQLGQESPASWSPPKKLILEGPYRYVRNPMISAVFFMLFGEVCFFLNNGLGLWFILFVLANMIYIPMVEEKALENRFGKAYLEYKRLVPRWIPLNKPGI